MAKLARTFVSFVETVNYRVGRITMYSIFLLMGVLLYSTFSKAAGSPSQWTLEMAQFLMVAYYILGGPYSIQMGSNVRMDLFYHNWSPLRKAWFDAFTVLFLIFYLGVMLYGAIDSTSYSLQYNERSPTAWRPYLWPIKLILCFGIVLMIAQALVELIKDIFRIQGEEL